MHTILVPQVCKKRGFDCSQSEKYKLVVLDANTEIRRDLFHTQV